MPANNATKGLRGNPLHSPRTNLKKLGLCKEMSIPAVLIGVINLQGTLSMNESPTSMANPTNQKKTSLGV